MDEQDVNARVLEPKGLEDYIGYSDVPEMMGSLSIVLYKGHASVYFAGRDYLWNQYVNEAPFPFRDMFSALRHPTISDEADLLNFKKTL